MNEFEKQVKAWKKAVKKGLVEFMLIIATLTIIVETSNNPAWMKISAALSAAYLESQVALLLMKIDDIKED